MGEESIGREGVLGINEVGRSTGAELETKEEEEGRSYCDRGLPVISSMHGRWEHNAQEPSEFVRFCQCVNWFPTRCSGDRHLIPPNLSFVSLAPRMMEWGRGGRTKLINPPDSHTASAPTMHMSTLPITHATALSRITVLSIPACESNACVLSPSPNCSP